MVEKSRCMAAREEDRREMELMLELINTLPSSLLFWVITGITIVLGVLTVLRVIHLLRHGVAVAFPPDR